MWLKCFEVHPYWKVRNMSIVTYYPSQAADQLFSHSVKHFLRSMQKTFAGLTPDKETQYRHHSRILRLQIWDYFHYRPTLLNYVPLFVDEAMGSFSLIQSSSSSTSLRNCCNLRASSSLFFLSDIGAIRPSYLWTTSSCFFLILSASKCPDSTNWLAWITIPSTRS